MGLFGKKKTEELVAIFDIGSGSVGGALVSFPIDTTEIPVIKKSFRTDINYTSDKINVGLFTNSMLKALHSTADGLFQGKIGAPDRIVVVVASPWYSSETRMVKMTKEIPFIFTHKIADDLLDKELKSITLDNTKKTKTIYNELEIMEHHIMDVSLNGYEVLDPIGMRTKSVEMNMIFSFSQKLFLDKIRKEIIKTFNDIPVYFSSFIVASYFAVRDKYVSPDSYLLLDIGGEVTEVGIVSKGILKASLSFPFGKKTFYKYICTKLEIELRDAKEIISLYNSGDMSSEQKTKYELLFKSIESSWSEAFRECIGGLPHVLALPSTVFLTADSDILNWFTSVVSNEEYIQSMTIDHKCTVVSLKSSDFFMKCRADNGVDLDPFLMIEVIALMRK